jgi:hypothetical protein
MGSSATPTPSLVDQDYAAVQALESTYNGDVAQENTLQQAVSNAEAALASAQTNLTNLGTTIATDGSALAAGYQKLATDATAAAAALAPPPPPAAPATK